MPEMGGMPSRPTKLFHQWLDEYGIIFFVVFAKRRFVYHIIVKRDIIPLLPETDGMPSRPTKLPHQLLDTRFTDRVILRIFVVDNNRRRGLLRYQLVCRAEAHAQITCHRR